MPSKASKTDAQTRESDAGLYRGFEHYPPAKVYRLVEPGSLADGTHHIMTAGFHMVIQHESPPLLGISPPPSSTFPRRVRAM